MNEIWAIIILTVAVVGIVWAIRNKAKSRPIPEAIRPGKTLPDFTVLDEDGTTLSSSSLRGSPTVLLFVRGTWCPFCSKQVANLTHYYNEITSAGARLILVTPKPLDTTRRVADAFGVNFEFWLDESLSVAKSLDLLSVDGVPGKHRADYGNDTLWPTSLVIDAEGVIQFAELSRFIVDRPNPEKLLAVVKRLQK